MERQRPVFRLRIWRSTPVCSRPRTLSNMIDIVAQIVYYIFTLSPSNLCQNCEESFT